MTAQLEERGDELELVSKSMVCEESIVRLNIVIEEPIVLQLVSQ